MDSQHIEQEILNIGNDSLQSCLPFQNCIGESPRLNGLANYRRDHKSRFSRRNLRDMSFERDFIPESHLNEPMSKMDQK